MSTEEKQLKVLPIVPFLEKFFYLPNGELVKLTDHQKAFFEFVFTPKLVYQPTYERYLYQLPFKQFCFSAPKKSGKTSIAAMIASWFAFSGIIGCGDQDLDRNGEIYFAACDQEASMSRGYRDLRRSLEYETPKKVNPLKRFCEKTQDKVLVLKNGTIIQALANDYAGAAGSNPHLSLFDELWNFTCFPLQNQVVRVLTENGWKDAKDISLEDKIATLKDNTWLEYQNPTRILIKKYNGRIKRFNHRHRKISYTVTPNHRVFAAYAKNGTARSKLINEIKKGDNSSYSYLEADSACKAKFGIMKADAKWAVSAVTTININGKEYNAEDFCELFGWYTAEGNIVYQKFTPKTTPRILPVGIFISQSFAKNNKKYEEIYELAKKMGLRPTRGKNGIRIRDDSLGQWFSSFGKSHQKYIPLEIKKLNIECLNRFLYGYLNGDGSLTPTGNWQMFTISKQLADDLLEIGLKCGWVPRLMGEMKNQPTCPKTQKSWNPEKHQKKYRISFSTGLIAWEQRMNHWSDEYFTGDIWCPTLPNGNFYVSVNGNCFWTGNSEGDRRLWDELTPPPTRINSMRIITTYAGFIGESELLEDIYKKIVREKNKHDLGKFLNARTGEYTDLPIYVDGDSVCIWDHEPRMPWQDEKYYQSQLNQPGFRMPAYRRLHLNEWTESSNPLEMDQWDNCVDMANSLGYFGPPTHDRNLQIAVGIDASVVKDRTAVVSVFKKDGKLWLGKYKYWQPSQEDPLNFEKTIEEYINELNDKFFISVVHYDPFQMESTAQRLKTKGINMVPWPQTVPNTVKMSELLMDKLRENGLVIWDSKELRQEASMTTIKEVPGRGRRIVKDNKNKKIDSIIALAMACLGAENFCPDFGSLGDQIMMLKMNRNNR